MKNLEIETHKSFRTFDGFIVFIENVDNSIKNYPIYTGHIEVFGGSRFLFNKYGECITVMPIGNDSDELKKINFSSFDIVLDTNAEEINKLEDIDTYEVIYSHTVMVNARSLTEAIDIVNSEAKVCTGEFEITSVRKL